jgi:hypothetical protein
MLLAACSFSGIGEPIVDPFPDANAISEAYETIHSVYPGLKLAGNPEASSIHRVRSGYLAEWVMCVRNDDPGARRHYAFYFNNRKLVDWRLSAIVERCETETYAPLPPPKPKALCDGERKGSGGSTEIHAPTGARTGARAATRSELGSGNEPPRTCGPA